MEINLLHMLTGAKEARGIAVIIDVFRAFSTACYVMANGAQEIIPVGDIEVARQLKANGTDRFDFVLKAAPADHGHLSLNRIG